MLNFHTFECKYVYSIFTSSSLFAYNYVYCITAADHSNYTHITFYCFILEIGYKHNMFLCLLKSLSSQNSASYFGLCVSVYRPLVPLLIQSLRTFYHPSHLHQIQTDHNQGAVPTPGTGFTPNSVLTTLPAM